MLENYIKLLKEFIEFKSISTEKIFNEELIGNVNWLKKIFEQNEFKVEVLKSYGIPILIADYNFDKSIETCLLYGHYDVQPASKSDGWIKDPFQLYERNGRLYARGVIDNKGQILVHISTIFELIKRNKLKYNVKFIIEGSEETGSEGLDQCIKDNKDKLKCNFIILSDGEIVGNYPVIEAGCRGGFNCTLKFHTAETELHSGLFGGIIPNAAYELSRFINTLYDSKWHITIDGFYDNVEGITKDARNNNESIKFSLKDFKRTTGVKEIIKEEGIKDIYSQVGLRPTIQITGFQSGFNAEGYKNSIPNNAICKMNFRLVEKQIPKEIYKCFLKHLKKFVPSYVDYEITYDTPFYGFKVDLNNNYVKYIAALLEKSFRKQIIYKFSGGGLPIATTFNEILDAPTILVPLANEDCNMHGANENYDIKILKKAIEFSRLLFSK